MIQITLRLVSLADSNIRLIDSRTICPKNHYGLTIFNKHEFLKLFPCMHLSYIKYLVCSKFILIVNIDLDKLSSSYNQVCFDYLYILISYVHFRSNIKFSTALLFKYHRTVLGQAWEVNRFEKINVPLVIASRMYSK